LTAEIARLLDRLHASGKVHGGVEPLAVLFVGGAVRLADPLPPGKGVGADEVHASATAGASAPNGRQHDFECLGQTFALMLGGMERIEELPAAMRAVLARCGASDPATAFRSGNEIAEAIELALTAGEPPANAGRLEAAATSVQKARSVEPPASPVNARRRRPGAGHRSLLLMLCGLLLLGGAAIFLLRPAPQVEAPAGREASGPNVPTPEAVEEKEALEELLAALPDQPLPEEPDRPTAETVLREILENADNRPCQRLEIERNGPDLRLVGRTASASDRASIMARLDTLEEAVDTAIDIDESNRFCNLYDILKRRTAIAWPRLARLYPRRTSHRLSYGEELMIQVQTPAEPSHLIVDYFTADGMVVHLRAAAGGSTRLAPFTEIVVGDPLDGSSLRIGPPSGNEVILVLASTAPLFSTARPPTEKADAYLAELDAALGQSAARPIASTLTIETVSSDN
jgi:hypothetical protein